MYPVEQPATLPPLSVYSIAPYHTNCLRDQSEDWIETHYTYLIRTFWIGLLYFLISGVLAMLIIGFFLIFAAAVWVIVRCVIGLQKASKGEAIANPYSWWF